MWRLQRLKRGLSLASGRLVKKVKKNFSKTP
jgi:hypothetical protein